MTNKPELLKKLYYKCDNIGLKVNIYKVMNTYKILANETKEIKVEINNYISDRMVLSREKLLTEKGKQILIDAGYII